MNWLKHHAWLLIALAVAVLAGRMLLTTKHFYTHDDIQVFRVHEFVGCLKTFQIPCRWAPDLGKGYGYPWFNFYPPMIYIIPALLNLTGLSIVLSLNLFMFATFLLAAWSMFALTKELTRQDAIACLGSVLFTLYPFHAINVFVRGVYAENVAWSLAPLLLLLVYRQIISDKLIRSLPWLLAAVFLTHIISTFVLIGLSIFWAVSLSLIHRKKLTHTLGRLMVQIIIGLGIAAFFFAPAILEKNLVQSDSLTKGYFAYTNHYVSFFQLFREYKWNYEGSMWNEAPDEMPFMVGHVHTILLLLLSLGAGWLLTKKKIEQKQKSTIWLAIATGITFAGLLFLAHFKSDPIWTLVPPLAYVQFPWRFVVWAGIPLILTIVLLLKLMPTKIISVVTVAALICLPIYAYPFFFPKSYDTYSDRDLLTGSQQHEQQVKSLYDYLPVTVTQVPEEYADQSTAPYPIFYFPGWSATVNGVPVAIMPDPVFGLITPAEPISGQLKLKWSETPFRLAMDVLSLITAIGYGLYAYKSHVQ